MVAKEPDLDPVIMKNFLEENILQLDPSLLGENGLRQVVGTCPVSLCQKVLIGLYSPGCTHQC